MLLQIKQNLRCHGNVYKLLNIKHDRINIFLQRSLYIYIYIYIYILYTHTHTHIHLCKNIYKMQLFSLTNVNKYHTCHHFLYRMLLKCIWDVVEMLMMFRKIKSKKMNKRCKYEYILLDIIKPKVQCCWRLLKKPYIKYAVAKIIVYNYAIQNSVFITKSVCWL